MGLSGPVCAAIQGGSESAGLIPSTFTVAAAPHPAQHPAQPVTHPNKSHFWLVRADSY